MKKYCLAGVIVLCLGGAVFANAFSSFSGCVNNASPYNSGGPLAVSTYGTVTDASGTPITAGSPRQVQYIYVGGDGFINDPDGSGNVRVSDYKVNTATYYVGDDSDTGASFTGTNGKFFHGFVQSDAAEYTAVSPTASQFYVRVWDRDPSDLAALFGDSALFNPAVASQAGFPPPIPPNNVGLADFKVLLPKAIPAGPAVLDASGISASPPSATLNWRSALGARSYSYQVALAADVDYANPIDGASGTVYNSSRHAASIDSSTAKSVAVSLGALGDDKTYRFRVRAGNDFGNSDWVDGPNFYVPLTPNTHRPAVVTDLQSERGADSITLTWTAPYLLDAYGAPMAVTTYEVRVATTPIVDTWEADVAGHSNPNHLSNWAGATPITAAPYNFSFGGYTIKTYPEPQTLTVVNVASGSTYYVALKSANGAIMSYISNVTGAGSGGGGGIGGGPQAQTLTLESQVASGGHGINHFSMPFAGPWYAYKEDGITSLGEIANAYDLVKAIDLAADANIVSTFTKWVGAGSTPNETGVIITGSDPDAPGVPAALQAITLENGRAFELYSSQSLRIVIKNY